MSGKKRSALLRGLFQNHWAGWIPCAVVVMLLLFGQTHFADAAQLYADDDWNFRWDNTLKYSMGYRVCGRNEKLESNINGDDGNRNFSKGTITSNRFDMLSEFDLVFRERFGFRASAAAWYDFVYHQKTDNNSPTTVNKMYNRDDFPGETRRLHGEKVELLDGFVYGYGDIDNHVWNLRLGQHNVTWGESMFFSGNAISAGQGPIDAVKALSVPGSQIKELFRPVPQVSGSFGLMPGLTLAAYYQFEFRENQLPGAGSFFSSGDFFDEGGKRLLTAAGNPGTALFRRSDIEAKDSGQYGVCLRYATTAATYGLYYRKYNDRSPQVYVYPGQNAVPAVGKQGEYRLVYPEDIDLVGVSFATTFMDVSIGCDVSYRHNMDLASAAQYVLPWMKADNNDNALYALGDTGHVNLNGMYLLSSSPIYDSCTIMGEVEMARCLSVNKNRNAIDSHLQPTAWGMRLSVTPSYYQVLPNLDLDVPISVSGFPRGKATAMVGFGEDRGGDYSIGLSMKYYITWLATLQYTGYYGKPDTQMLYDRANISFSIQRTF